MLRVGAIIPNAGDAPGRLGIAEMAVAANAAGADGVWVSDHLLLVDESNTDYPYSADGAATWPVDTPYYEAFACCTAMAAATRRCRIGTAALVLPQRNALEVAKIAATIDRLSGGRLALGVGAGWNRLEFEALGYPYEARGRRFDEMLDVLHDCWTGRPAAFQGRQVAVPSNVVLQPVPVQPGGPPLLVGGMTDVARRRAARRGDGWLAIAFADRWDAADLRRRYDDVLAQRRDARPGAPFETLLKLHSTPELVDRVPELVAESAGIGFGEVIVEPPWLEGMEAAAAVIHAARVACR